MTTTTRRPFTLADATDARHLEEERAVAREALATARARVEVARFEERRCAKLLRACKANAARFAAEGNAETARRWAATVAGYEDDLKRARAELARARARRNALRTRPLAR